MLKIKQKYHKQHNSNEIFEGANSLDVQEEEIQTTSKIRVRKNHMRNGKERVMNDVLSVLEKIKANFQSKGIKVLKHNTELSFKSVNLGDEIKIFINLNYDELSEENKKISQELGTKSSFYIKILPNGKKYKEVSLSESIYLGSSKESMEEWADKLNSAFKNQKHKHKKSSERP